MTVVDDSLGRVARRRTLSQTARIVRRRRHAAAAAAVLVLAGVALRLALAVWRPLWADEIFTIELARRPVAEILSALRVDSGPPLHYLLARLCLLPFPSPGVADVLPRLLSVLAWAGHVPLLLRAGRRLGGGERGPLAAVLLSLLPIPVYFGAEGRGYMLASLLLLAALDGVLALRERPGRGRAVATGLLAGAAFLTHYLSAFPILGLATLLRGAPSRSRRALLLAAGVALAVVSPWLPVLLSQPRESMAWVVPEAVPERTARLLVNATLGFDLPGRGVLLLGLGALLLLALVVRASRPRDLAVPLLAAALGTQAAAGAVVPQLLLPERSAVLLLPLAALVVAGAGRAPALALTALGAIVLAAQAPGWWARPPLVDVAARLAPALRAGDRVVAAGLAGPELRYRLWRSGRPDAVVLFPSDVESHPGWYHEGGIPDARLAREALRTLSRESRPRFLVLPRGLRASAALRAAAEEAGRRTVGVSPLFEVSELAAPP